MPILNVEDHAPARFLRSRLLERNGFRVIESDTVAGAMRFALAVPGPRAILMDVGLPDGTGLEACEQIKAARPDLPVVLISAVYRTTNSRRDGYSAGADAYLLDPVDPAVLINTMKRMVGEGPTLPTTPPPIVRTASDGRIISANPAAARLMNVGSRGATGRSLLAFFDGNRPKLSRQMVIATTGRIVGAAASFRPRDRKPFLVQVEIALADVNETQLDWTFEVVPPTDRQ